MARDLLHEAVKHALIKDGWTITHDPLLLSFGTTNVYVDLAAEEHDKIIAVESKSFSGASTVTDLERALVKHALYRSLMREQDPSRTLHVAVSERAFNSFVGLPATMSVLRDEGVRLIVFDPDKEVVVSWMS
jgi:hypothetical protein